MEEESVEPKLSAIKRLDTKLKQLGRKLRFNRNSPDSNISEMEGSTLADVEMSGQLAPGRNRLTAPTPYKLGEGSRKTEEHPQ